MSTASVITNTRRKAIVHFISSNATGGNVTANLAYGPANLIYKAANGDNFQTFRQFDHEGAAPVNISLALTFTETTILTKREIVDGY